ncbi:MAG: potassium-transporting ATPase subunit F [Hyphomicrobiales bacterium]|nr:potassium-transporting ATPase subunit F [Hyphomicrobiales bacterium]
MTSFSWLSPSRFSSPEPATPCFATSFEGIAMVEPIFGLVVALVLGFYLLVTLVRPEKF